MRRRCFVSALVSVPFVSPATAQAKKWTESLARFVVPAAPGGTLDQLTRLLATEVGKLTGQRVIVENRAGGAGAPARQYVATGPSDGTLIFMGQVHEITRAALVNSVPYAMTKEHFEPASMIGEVPNVLVVNSKLPVKSVKDLLDWGKREGRELNYGVGSIGNLQNLAGILFQQQSGLALKSIPYKGSGPAIVDLISGQIDLLFETLPATLAHVASGKLRALAVTSVKRNPALKHVPSFTESGFPKMQMTTWYGAFLRTGVSQATTSQVSTAISTALASPELTTAWRQAGMLPPPYVSGERFSEFVSTEEKRWSDLVKATGAKVDE